MQTTAQTLMGKLVEWLVTVAPSLVEKFLDMKGVLHWWAPYESVYGAYRENHYGPAERALPDKSLIIIRPKFELLGVKRGMIIEGLCHHRRQELRKFESLEVTVKCKEPVTAEYSYLANARGNVFCNDGFVRFEELENRKYMQAVGHFILPHASRRSKRARNVPIRFEWTRIPPGEIRAIIGKDSLDGIGDIRRFLQGGGEL